MGKNKLKKFADMETFGCVYQFPWGVLESGACPMKGNWHERCFHNDNPIVLELGCGKGEYTVALAEKFPERNFIGIDIKGARLWKGAKYATEKPLPNVAFIRTRIEFITSLFAPGEVAEIWITFADPQEKKARKRLTAPGFLARYNQILAPGGIVHLKTDSRLLHNYTLQVAAVNGLPVLVHDEDIYGHGLADEVLSIKTFYEQSFLAKGIPITYLAFRPGTKKPLAEPDWDQTPYEQSYKTSTRNG